MRKLMTILLAVALLSVSCDKKNSNKESNCVPNKMVESDGTDTYLTYFKYDDSGRLSKLTYDDNSYALITYNSDGLADKWDEKNANGTDYGYYETYDYDSQKRLVRVHVYVDEDMLAKSVAVRKSSLQGGRNAKLLMKARTKMKQSITQNKSEREIEGTMAYLGYTEYVYDADGNVEREDSWSFNDAGELVKYTDAWINYMYDENGNIVTENDHEIQEGIDYIVRTTYTHDTKKNILRNVPIPGETHVNNVLNTTIVEKWTDGGTYVYDATYEYNDKDFPVVKTEEGTDGYYLKTSIDYDCR